MNININLPFLNAVSFTEKLLFTKHLSLMLKSGVPLAEAIDELRFQTKSATFAGVLTKVSKHIANGVSLHEALAKYPNVFSTLYISLVKIGEESGTLEKSLEYLAVQLKKEYEFSSKIKTAALYPSVILITALVVGMGVSLFVLPKLIDLFSSLEVELPLSTKILLFIANIMQHYGVLIMISVIALSIGFRFLISLPAVKPIWHTFLLRLPAFGPFLQNIQVASFSRNLGIMLTSGLPITTALLAIEQATNNAVYQRYVKELRTSMEKGKHLGDELKTKKYPFVPTLVGTMIAVGEKTGKLDEALLYLGDFYEEEVDTTAKNFSTILEPALLLTIGLIVAFLAMAIISPIYELTGSIRRE